MRSRGTKESARTLPRKWIEEEWGVDGVITPDDSASRTEGKSKNLLLKIRPGSAPTSRRWRAAAGRESYVYHAYTGRRVPMSQQQQHPFRRRMSGAADPGRGDVQTFERKNSWGQGGVGFAPRGRGPQLDPPHPTKPPTRPRWPTPSVEASVLRYIGMVRRDKMLNGTALFPGTAQHSVHPSKSPALRDAAVAVMGTDAPGPGRQSSRSSSSPGGGGPRTVAWPEHRAMEGGDVVVTVEHCHGCQGHRMTTRHDPEMYLRHANAVKELLLASSSLRECPIRLAVVLKRAALRATTSPDDVDAAAVTGGGVSGGGGIAMLRRVGAFEVQVAARHPSGAGPYKQVVHSKLASGRWPRLENARRLPNKVKKVLLSWGFPLQEAGTKSGEEEAAPSGATAITTASDSRRSEQRQRRSLLPPVSWEFDHREVHHDDFDDAVLPSPKASTGDGSSSKGGIADVSTGRGEEPENDEGNGSETVVNEGEEAILEAVSLTRVARAVPVPTPVRHAGKTPARGEEKWGSSRGNDVVESTAGDSRQKTATMDIINTVTTSTAGDDAYDDDGFPDVVVGGHDDDDYTVPQRSPRPPRSGTLFGEGRQQSPEDARAMSAEEEGAAEAVVVGGVEGEGDAAAGKSGGIKRKRARQRPPVARKEEGRVVGYSSSSSSSHDGVGTFIGKQGLNDSEESVDGNDDYDDDDGDELARGHSYSYSIRGGGEGGGGGGAGGPALALGGETVKISATLPDAAVVGSTEAASGRQRDAATTASVSAATKRVDGGPSSSSDDAKPSPSKTERRLTPPLVDSKEAFLTQVGRRLEVSEEIDGGDDDDDGVVSDMAVAVGEDTGLDGVVIESSIRSSSIRGRGTRSGSPHSVGSYSSAGDNSSRHEEGRRRRMRQRNGREYDDNETDDDGSFTRTGTESPVPQKSGAEEAGGFTRNVTPSPRSPGGRETANTSSNSVIGGDCSRISGNRRGREKEEEEVEEEEEEEVEEYFEEYDSDFVHDDDDSCVVQDEFERGYEPPSLRRAGEVGGSDDSVDKAEADAETAEVTVAASQREEAHETVAAKTTTVPTRGASVNTSTRPLTMEAVAAAAAAATAATKTNDLESESPRPRSNESIPPPSASKTSTTNSGNNNEIVVNKTGGEKPTTHKNNPNHRHYRSRTGAGEGDHVASSAHRDGSDNDEAASGSPGVLLAPPEDPSERSSFSLEGVEGGVGGVLRRVQEVEAEDGGEQEEDAEDDEEEYADDFDD